MFDGVAVNVTQARSWRASAIVRARGASLGLGEVSRTSRTGFTVSASCELRERTYLRARIAPSWRCRSRHGNNGTEMASSTLSSAGLRPASRRVSSLRWGHAAPTISDRSGNRSTSFRGRESRVRVNRGAHQRCCIKPCRVNHRVRAAGVAASGARTSGSSAAVVGLCYVCLDFSLVLGE